MKKLLIAIFFLLVVQNTYGQLTENKFHLYGKASYGVMDSSNYINTGIALEFMINKRWGLNYNLEYKYKTDGYSHIHGSAGTLGAPLLFFLSFAIPKNENNNNPSDTTKSNFRPGLFIAGILTLIIPDGVSYHIPVKKNIDFSPYVNLLGVDYVFKKDYNDIFYSLSFGGRATFMLSDKITLNTFVETRKVARIGWGAGGGLGIGFVFN